MTVLRMKRFEKCKADASLKNKITKRTLLFEHLERMDGERHVGKTWYNQVNQLQKPEYQKYVLT